MYCKKRLKVYLKFAQILSPSRPYQALTLIVNNLLRSLTFMVSSLFRLFLLFTQTRAYLAVVEGRHCHHHYCHHHHYDHQSHHDNMITLIMSRYGHCYEYLSGGAMFSACSCLAGTEFVNNKITTKTLLQILQNRDFFNHSC